MFKEYDNTIVFKSFQAHSMVDINFVKKERKKKVKSSTVGDPLRSCTVA